MPKSRSEFLVTRRSLVDRLGDWHDAKRWQQFFDSYWKLIHRAARKAGLTESEAQEVVQETLITVAKKIERLKYDPKLGSFKGWLLNITRWRIADQFRKRRKAGSQNAKTRHGDESRLTATIERIADPAGFDLDAAWEEEWRANLREAATARAKKKVSAKQYQIFDCYVLKGWPVQKVAKELGVTGTQVYLARHRVGALLKREMAKLEKAR